MTTSLGSKATPDLWQRAKLVAEGYLICAAQARRPVTYTELDRALQAAVGGHIAGPAVWGQFSVTS